MSAYTMNVWRCDITGNPVGTDTRMIGCPCMCQGCRAGAEIERLQAKIDRIQEVCLLWDEDHIDDYAAMANIEAASTPHGT